MSTTNTEKLNETHTTAPKAAESSSKQVTEAKKQLQKDQPAAFKPGSALSNKKATSGRRVTKLP